MGNTAVKDLNFDEIQPREVFKLSKDFTWEELKNAYKHAALKTHPDKQGGNKELFDFVTKTFEKLAYEFKERESNKSHSELKKNSEEFAKEMSSSFKPFEFENTHNFSTKFNKAFDQFKYHDDDIETGYGDIMQKSTDMREDFHIENLFNKSKVNNSTFNEVFDQKVPVSNKIVKRQEPVALPMAKKLQYTEIGVKNDDYSGKTESQSLSYTDYLRAHNGERLVDPKSKFKEYKSIKEYQSYREKKTKTDLTEKEKAKIEKKKILEEQNEKRRLERVNQNDRAIQIAHEKATQFLIR